MNRTTVNAKDAIPQFSLSAASLAAGTAAPLAERRARRAHMAWLSVILAVAATVWYAAGALAGTAAATIGILLWQKFGMKTSRRRREVWKMPFPPHHEKILLRRIPHYRSLDESGRELFRQRTKMFLDETTFHGAGVKVTDGLRLRAAAAAVVPTLGFEEWEWTDLKEIIFRPDGYEHGAYESEDGVVTEYEESGMIGGPGILSGTMMLSSEDLKWEFAHPEDELNVGIHEFAHLMAGQGLALAEADRETWPDLMESEFAQIRRNDSLLDEYALLNEDEFFAVSSELFFTVPRRFCSWHRKLYSVLARCYRQNPAAWLDWGEPEPDRPPRRKRRKK